MIMTLFLGFAKRRAELETMDEAGADHRDSHRADMDHERRAADSL